MRKKEALLGYRKTTWIVHGPGRTKKWDFAHHVVPPLTSSATYRLESIKRAARGFSEFGKMHQDDGKPPVYIYDRLEEPTRSLLEGELAVLEGGDACLTFASGMAAISAALGAVLKTGDEVVAHPVLYGCTHSLFTLWYPKLGIKVERADFTDLDAVERAITDRTRVLFFESPVNPNLDMVDLKAVKKLCDRVNRGRPAGKKLLSMIDNTFATPFCQRPLEHGIDIVVHSLTKNLGGFGTDVGGAVICSRGLYRDVIMYRKDFGGILGPKSAWAILVYGLPTLPLRVKRQQYSAHKVARFLEDHPFIKEVRYPGLKSFPWHALALRQMRDLDGDFAPGNMIYFRTRPDRVDPVRFIDDIAKRAYSITLAVSLGHTKTLVDMPSQMTHSAYGGKGPMSGENGIRLSIGLESPVDIIRDLETSLRRTAKRR